MNPEIPIEVDPELVLQDTGEMVDIEGIHERIQSERLEEEKENRSRAEEILERPPAWNEVHCGYEAGETEERGNISRTKEA